MLSLPLGTAQAFARRIFLNKCYTSVRPYVSGPVEGGRASVPDGPTVNVPSKEVVTALPPLSQPVPDLGPVQYARPGDQSNVTQVTRLSNGLRVASENRFGQFCTVGVVIDSGPRYELAYPSGISHFLEKLAFQSTASFGEKDVIFKELEKHGGICDCQSSRDTFVYAASADSRGVEAVTRILADVVLRPRLANEEVEFARQTVKFELETLGMRPEQEPILMDMIHAAGFRDNTLGLPKLCPLKTADQIDRNMLLTYLRHHHTPDRMVLAGVGVPHDELVRLAERFFVEGSATWESEKIHAKNPTGVDTSIAQYTGGSKLEECAIPVYAAVGLPELAHVVIGLKGCSHQDKDFIAACVLNIMMGGGGSFSAGGPGKGMYTRLYTNVLNRYHWMYSATAYNHAYGDSESRRVITRELYAMQGRPGDQELRRAKTQLQSMLLMNLEARPVVFEDIGRQVLATGERRRPEHFIQEIEKITAEDIQNVAKRFLASPPALAARGEIKGIPDVKDIQTALAGGEGRLPGNRRLSLFR
ncbi:mitochondrial-processing peptidase alpha subunit [Culex quinquefasciatus]|uniref:Mitochondrial-processing peptidase subunit alpha n=1 Tax=Culex quinquefasciatus TaxID=7176 RepID=B0W4M3_CULQU|nr:mitochondrial-processing peptidase alpha subunit [Culex quinquefasciatus]|eukprot:XP_001843657.1 mitochondrial-processing peptidase alpha subunit [Culex quinquefasciatus]